MDAKTQPAAKPKPPVGWDEYFPAINSAIMLVLLSLAVIFATGVDVVGIATKLVGGGSGDSERVTVASAPAGEAVAGSSKPVSFSMWEKGGWKYAVIIVVVLACIGGLSLSVLSTSGRDSVRAKEQAAKNKEDRKSKPPGGTDASAAESTECNLASYKLFYPDPVDAAAKTETAASPARA